MSRVPAVTRVRYALPQPYEELEHTADTGVAVEGGTPEEVLARLVLAQTALLAGGGPVKVTREERLTVDGGGTLAELAVTLLRELLFRFATERLLAGSCEVHRLDARTGAEVAVGFGPRDPDLHADGMDVKAVTRHGARFEEHGGRWRAQVVLDI